MVLETPFFSIVSVPVRALNFMVVPSAAGVAPKAEVPNRLDVGVAVCPKRPVPCVWPNRLPVEGVAAENEPNWDLCWPNAVEVAPKMPPPAGCCGVAAPNMEVLVAGAPKPANPGVADVAGCPKVELVLPNSPVFCAAPPNSPALVPAAVVPKADPPNTLEAARS